LMPASITEQTKMGIYRGRPVIRRAVNETQLYFIYEVVHTYNTT
jgi:hypothetical protein